MSVGAIKGSLSLQELAAAAAGKPKVNVQVWENDEYPQIIESVTITEDGESVWYINENYDAELEEAELEKALAYVS